jgi:hypothetical protein
MFHSLFTGNANYPHAKPPSRKVSEIANHKEHKGHKVKQKGCPTEIILFFAYFVFFVVQLPLRLGDFA